jgi:hypothetical protein
MSILEEATVFAEGPMMGVFNNLVMFDQHVKQNSLSLPVETAFTGLHIRGRTYCPGATIALISGE